MRCCLDPMAREPRCGWITSGPAATAGAGNNQGGTQGAGGASDPTLAGATAGDATAAQPSAATAPQLGGALVAVSIDGFHLELQRATATRERGSARFDMRAVGRWA